MVQGRASEQGKTTEIISKFRSLHGDQPPRQSGAKPDAAPPGSTACYRRIALHHQRHSLFRELNDADRRSGPMQAMQFGRAIEARLSEVDGTEACLGGFGRVPRGATDTK
jgi:hypothetical protein